MPPTRVRGVVDSLVLLVSALMLSLAAFAQGNADDTKRVAVGAEIQVVALSDNPSAEEKTQVQQAFAKGHIIRSTAEGQERLRTLLGIPLTRATPTSGAPGHPTSVLRVVAVRRNARGEVHQFSGLTSSADAHPEASADKLLADWVATERASSLQDTQVSPPAQYWTALLLFSNITSGTEYGNTVSLTLSLYRLNDQDTAHDYYMVTTDASRDPNFYLYGSDVYDNCDGFGCSYHTVSTNIQVTPTYSVANLPAAIIDHGPTGTVTSGTNGFTIGVSPAGPSAGYSQNWSQPSITTTDHTTLLAGGWEEDVNFTGAACLPLVGTIPIVSYSTYISHQGLVFQVPAGTTDVTVKGGMTTDFCNANNYAPSPYPPGWSTDVGQIQFQIVMGPPQFTVNPSSLTIPPGGSAVLHVNAVIPNSSLALSWNATPDSAKNWLDVDTGPFAGSQEITVRVEPDTPLGDVSFVNLNTTPAFAAPSVASGPVEVNVTVGNPPPSVLTSGVLLTGGFSGGNSALATAEVYDETSKTIKFVGPMNQVRALHTATELQDGTVLIAGGATTATPFPNSTPTATAEIFDPATTRFTPVGSMGAARESHTATLLSDGRVLITGGYGGANSENSALRSAEIYDPKTRSFSPAGTMKEGRASHGAIAFDDGKKVLVFGGDSVAASQSWEIWNADSNSFAGSGPMNAQTQFPPPVEGRNGVWDIVGGFDHFFLTTDQLVMPEVQSFRDESQLNVPRAAHTLTALKDGSLLVTGGMNRMTAALSSTELKGNDGTWSLGPNLLQSRIFHSANLLGDGTVLIAGGRDSLNLFLGSTEIYDPVAGTFTSGPSITPRSQLVGTHFTATNVPTVTTLSSSNPSVSVGTEVAFTATVTPGLPSGTVTFYDGSSTLGTVNANPGGNTWVFRTNTLSGGQHVITAAYSGSGTFQKSVSQGLTQQVQALTTTTTLSAAPNPGQTNAQIALTAKVTDSNLVAVSGNTPIKFFDGSTLLGSALISNGVANLQTSFTTAGAHNLSATYPGTPTYAPSSGMFTEQINPPKIRTTVLVSSNLNPSGLDQQVTFTAAVSPAVSAHHKKVGAGDSEPTGTLIFYADKTTYLGTASLANGNNGVGQVTFSSLSRGTHTISVAYSGDDTYLSSSNSGAPLSQSVGQAAAFSGLTPSQTITAGTSAISLYGVVAAPGPLYPPAGEQVTITIGDPAHPVRQTVTIGANGSFSTTTFPAGSLTSTGTYEITYFYPGDNTFNSGTNTSTTLTVQKAAPVFNNLTPSQTITTGASTISLAGQLAAAGPLYPPAGEQVTISIGSASQSVTLGANGTFSTSRFPVSSLNADGSPYTIIYKYDGDNSFAPVSNTSTRLQVKTATPQPVFSKLTPSQAIVFGTAAISLSGVISAPGPRYPAPGEAITITIGELSRKVSIGANGTFSIANFPTSSLTVNGSPYTITYNYAGDANLNPRSNSSTTLAINQASPAFSDLSPSQTITKGTRTLSLSGVISAAGPLYPPAGEQVTLSIGGVSQPVTLGANGAFAIASFPVSSLNASGSPYTILYSYPGDANFKSRENSSTHVTVKIDATPRFSNLTPSQTISQGTPTISLSGVISATGNLFPPVGETVIISIGNFTELLGTSSQQTATIQANGVFSIPAFPTAALTAAGSPYPVTYSYAGDDHFNSVTNRSTSLTVLAPAKRPTTTTILPFSQVTVPVGEGVMVAYAVVPKTGKGDPTGTVIVQSNTGRTCSGTVSAGSCLLTFTGPGAKLLTANYEGDTSFAASTSAAVLVTAKCRTRATLTASPNPSAVSATVTFTVRVTPVGSGCEGIPGGNVTLAEHMGQQTTPLAQGNLDSSGAVVFTVNSLSKGSHLIDSTYGGDTEFFSATSNGVNQAVN